MQVLPLQKAGAVTWSAPEQMTNSSNPDNFPSALTATDGTVWLVWDTTRTGRWNIFYKTYDGTSWSPDTQITSELFSNKAPTIVQLKNGTIILIYQWYRTDNWDIYLRTWRGSYWSDPAPVVESTYADAGPSASVATDGTLWLTWERRLTSTNADIYYKTYSGGVWSSDTPLPQANSSIDEIVPSILATREGKVVATWTKLVSGTNYNVYYQVRDSGVWSSPGVLAGTNDFEMGWGLAQDRNGILWAFYSRERSAGGGQFQDEIYYSTSTDGNTWCCNTQLTFDPPGDPIQDTESRAIQGPDKRLWLFFNSDRSGDWEVWLMKTDPILTHDVAAVSIAPTEPIVTSSVKVTGQVANLGDYLETLQVSLKLNGTTVSTWTLSLAAGSTAQITTTITVDWKNAGPVKYQLTLTVAQVTGEPQANLYNNTVSQIIKLSRGPGLVCRIGNPCQY